MSTNAARTIFILALNDLHSVVLWRLLLRRGFQVIVAEKPWGKPLANGAEILSHVRNLSRDDGTPQRIVLVDLEDAWLEAALTATGASTERISGQILDEDGLPKSGKPSSPIEQIIDRWQIRDLSANESRIVAQVVANEIGFIPALAQTVKAQDGNAGDVCNIRLRDLAIILQQGRGDARASLETPGDGDLLALPPAWLHQAEEELNAARDAIDIAPHVVFSTRRHDDPAGLGLALLPYAHRKAAADAWYFRDGANDLDRLCRVRDVLFLFTETPSVREENVKDAALRYLFFSGAAAHWPFIRPHVQVYTGNDAKTPITAFARVAAHTCMAGWVDRTASVLARAGNDGAGELNAIADNLLNDLLAGRRPVSRWRTSFFQAFQLPDFENILRKPGKTSLHPVCATSGEAGYFLPHLRARLAPGTGQAFDKATLRSWRVALRERLSLLVEHGNYDPQHLRADIAGVWLHAYGPDTVLLEWQVVTDNRDACPQTPCESTPDATDSEEPPPPLPEGNNPCLWRHYLNGAEKDGWSFAQVIDFIAEARHTWLGYLRQSQNVPLKIILCDAEGRALTELTYEICQRTQREWQTPESPPVIGPLRWLLAQALGEEHAKQAKLLFDDRARVLTSLILAGGAPGAKSRTQRFDPLLACLNMVDPYGEGHPYDADFSRRELDESRYTRYWGWGSWYMATDHSFNFVGFRHPLEEGDPDPKPGFAEREVHGRHMCGPYRRMWLLGLAQQAGLLALALDFDRLFRHKETALERLARKLTSVRQKLHRFLSLRSFERLSSQVQGIELYDHIRARLRLPEQLEALRRRIVEQEEFIDRQRKDEEERRKIEEERKRQSLEWAAKWLGLPVAAALFLATLLSVNNADFTLPIGGWLRDFSNHLPFWNQGLNQFLTFTFMSIMLAGMTGLAWKYRSMRVGFKKISNSHFDLSVCGSESVCRMAQGCKRDSAR